MLSRLRGGIVQLRRDVTGARRDLVRNRAALIVLDLALLPWFVTILVHRDLGVWLPLAEILGLILVYWFLTRGRPFEYSPVRRPVLETAFGLALVAVWILYRIVEFARVLPIPIVPLGICQDMADTLTPKLIEMVLLPLGVLFALRYWPRQIGLAVPVRAWIPALLPLAAYIVWGLSHQSPGTLFTRTSCFYLGAGLPEELLFRGIVQTRLTALLKNPWYGLFLASFIFGLSHMPIDLHGSGFTDWSSAILTAFTYQMGVGLALGYAFRRSRNLWPLTLIHALIDSAS